MRRIVTVLKFPNDEKYQSCRCLVYWDERNSKINFTQISDVQEK